MNNFPDILSGHSEQLTALHNLSASCRPKFMSAVYKYNFDAHGKPHNSSLKRKSNNAERQLWSKCICDALLSLLVAFFKVPMQELCSPRRGNSKVARVRQFGMYIAHTMFGMSMSEVALAFSRERTTVKHACHVIEDLRENKSFDYSVSAFEYLIRMIYPEAGSIKDE